jgi:hypothetical protein
MHAPIKIELVQKIVNKCYSPFSWAASNSTDFLISPGLGNYLTYQRFHAVDFYTNFTP